MKKTPFQKFLDAVTTALPMLIGAVGLGVFTLKTDMENVSNRVDGIDTRLGNIEWYLINGKQSIAKKTVLKDSLKYYVYEKQ